jgi:Amt family ammonium transporter
MTRRLLVLVAALVLGISGTVGGLGGGMAGGMAWGEEAALPAATPAAAAPATPPAAAAPAAAPAPVDKPKTIEERLTALEAATKGATDSVNEAAFNAGDNAWVLVSSALVLLMTLPGLALFYGGMVRKKNVLATLMQSLTIACLVSLLWALIGYSIAFGPGASVARELKDEHGQLLKDDKGVVRTEPVPLPSASYWGGFSYRLLDHVVTDSARDAIVLETAKDGSVQIKTPAGALVPGPYAGYCPSINHGSYMLFQLMFAIITPALICGGYAERMKFSSMCLFSALWLLLVYCPLAHMVWGENGYFNWAFPKAVKSPAFDFAGGTVVHISSGVAALMSALFLGRRKGYPESPMPPHNLTLSFIGAMLLWVGWFGFNAGSALQANGLAVIAFANTHFATAAAALAWPLAEWLLRGKPTVLGAISGAVAGLVAVTPASGFVTPMGAIVLGLVAGVLCFITSSYLKRALGYDDALDAFGVHAIGGMWGAIATGIFFNVDTNPGIAASNPELYLDIVTGKIGAVALVIGQAKAVATAVVLSAVGSALILALVKATIGLRVTRVEEMEGLDLSLHGEEGYALTS